jgi:hypothetical protein
MLPDVIVLGDSHCNALVDGCHAHGLKAEMLRFSGNFWHTGQVSLHADHGIWINRPKRLQDEILALRERLGGRSVLSPDVPVLATMGFHLGRFVPPFGIMGHVTDQRHFDAEPDALYASRAMVNAYIGAYRGTHIRMARRMDRMARVVMVAPPLCHDRPNLRTFFDSVLARMRAVNLTVYDPNGDLPRQDGVLDPAYVTEDGAHGNARYGAEVIGKLIEQGLLARAG